MSVKYQLSFSSGEIDPILHDNVYLAKFKKGLETARNVMVGSTGTIMSRFATEHLIKAKNDNQKIKIYSPSPGLVTEWGAGYVRLINSSGGILREDVHSFTEDDLETMHFATSKNSIYVFVKDKLPIVFDIYSTHDIAYDSGIMFDLGRKPDSLSVTGLGSGYDVNYAVTVVRKGEESLFVEYVVAGAKKPDAAGESFKIDVRVDVSALAIDDTSEIRVYRRPHEGSGYGFIGSSSYKYLDGTDVRYSFEDFGGLADFTNGLPLLVDQKNYQGDYREMKSSTGTIYQQRLLMTSTFDYEAILSSRPGFHNNFQRDKPYDADSALKFKSGTSGNARVLRMIDSDGLIVFTSVGVYLSLGVLSVTNLALEKKGSWIIDEKIPPLLVPGGVFFVDKSTNSVRQFVYSQDIGTYQSLNSSIFSGHLFNDRTIKSWTFQSGSIPLIIISLSDGTFATFTYDQEHQMKAWTRHDSVLPVEQVESTGEADSSFFVVNKDGNRYIEMSLPRRTSASDIVANPEYDKLAANCMIDSSKTQSALLRYDSITIVPSVPGDWESDLTITTVSTFPTFTGVTAGDIFRYFNTIDRTVVDLKVISKASDLEVVVRPSAEFPSDQVTEPRLYETSTVITGLDHLEGEVVAVMVDGWVASSPNNDIDNYEKFTVTGGSITLPDDKRGAIIVVGRPVTADIKTLNIATVEQTPTGIESLTVNKVYIRVHKSRGLYISNDFPEESEGEKDGNSVKGMEDMQVIDVPNGFDILGNTYVQPVSKRIEKTLPGSWNSQGRMSIRQVDPLHFEIISIIPDVEIERRTDN